MDQFLLPSAFDGGSAILISFLMSFFDSTLPVPVPTPLLMAKGIKIKLQIYEPLNENHENPHRHIRRLLSTSTVNDTERETSESIMDGRLSY